MSRGLRKMVIKAKSIREGERHTNVSAGGRVKAVIRVMSISTRYELQQQRYVSLFCVLNYDDDDRSAAIFNMLFLPRYVGLFCKYYYRFTVRPKLGYTVCRF